MRIDRASRIAAAACLAWMAGSAAVRADAIDGNWCAGDGRTFSIDGPRIVTPRGEALQGEYDRHGFAYVEPPPDGTSVTMVLLDEDTVRLTAGAEPEIWHRCDVTS
jgi:hypothetical protein